jgi:hypothetical protein
MAHLQQVILEHKTLRPCIEERKRTSRELLYSRNSWELRCNSADKKEIEMFTENKKWKRQKKITDRKVW